MLRSRGIFPRLRLHIFFRLQLRIKKDFSFVSTQEISAPTGPGSEKQIVKICLDSAPILTQNIYIFIKSFNQFRFGPKHGGALEK